MLISTKRVRNSQRLREKENTHTEIGKREREIHTQRYGREKEIYKEREREKDREKEQIKWQ